MNVEILSKYEVKISCEPCTENKDPDIRIHESQTLKQKWYKMWLKGASFEEIAAEYDKAPSVIGYNVYKEGYYTKAEELLNLKLKSNKNV